MTFSLRHICLLTGMFAVIVSFLWFGRNTNSYDIIFLAGFLISCLSFLVILFKPDTLKSKLLWTLVVVLAMGLQWLTEPLLIRTSYSIFINKHDKDLASATSLIASKKSDLSISPSSELWTEKGFTEEEGKQIRGSLKNTGVRFVSKDSIKIFYMTWGMLDVSHGIYYFYSDIKPDNRYRRIFGNWYY